MGEGEHVTYYFRIQLLRIPTTMLCCPRTRKVRKPPAVDRCWHVTIITSVTAFIISGIFRTAAYFYIGFMHEFGVNRNLASWPHSILSALGGLVGKS